MQKELSFSDKKKLRKKLWSGVFMALFVIGFFYVIFRFLSKSFLKSNDAFTYIPFFFFGIIGIFFGVVLFMIFRGVIIDLQLGIKETYQGVISDKQHKVNIRSGTRNHGTGFRGSKSRGGSTTHKYFITLDDVKHLVTFKMFKDIKVGDKVYFEKGPKSGTIFSYEVLSPTPKGTLVSENENRLNRLSYHKHKIQEAPLSKIEIEKIKSFFRKKFSSRVFVLLFFGLPTLGLLISGYGSLLIFLFPLPLVILYQLYKLINLCIKYNKVLYEGKKLIISAYVIDKLRKSISKNGSKSSQITIETSYGAVNVSENVYDSINTSDEIIIHKAKYLPIFLSVDGK